jgi:hypothetical protein
VAAYQSATPLKLGELWAIPIMLRLALIENLRRVGARIAAGALDRNRAEAWADQMMEVADRDPKSLILVIADMVRSNPPMESSFVAELARRLQGQSAALALPLTWIEQRLSETGMSIEQLVQAETQAQAGVQVTMSNTIGSLRVLGAVDWREFVEAMSVVERNLRAIRAGSTPAWTSPRATATATWSRRSPGGAAFPKARWRARRWRSAREGARGRALVPRRLLPRGRGPAAPRALRRACESTLRGPAPRGRPPSAASVSRRGRRRSRSCWPRDCSRRHADGGSTGRCWQCWAVLLLLAASQLAVGTVNWLATLFVSPTPAAADGFRRPASRRPRARWSSSRTMLTERSRHREPGRGARGALPRQPRCAPALRPAHRLRRTPRRRPCPRDESLLRAAREGIEEIEQKHGRPGHVLPRSTARASGTRRSARGWATSASAASSRTLNAFLRAGARDRFALVVGAPRSWRTCAT